MKQPIFIIPKLREFEIAPRGILHIGAGNVEEAEEYQAFGFKKVFWVDILDCNSERRRMAEKMGHKFICAAMAEDAYPEAPFHVASNGCSSSLLPFGSHLQIYPTITEEKVIHVETMSGRELLKLYPEIAECNVLNLDVQGAELRVLEGFGDLLAQFDFIFCEVYLADVYWGCGKLDAVNALLYHADFVCMDVWIKPKEQWGNGIWVKRNLL